MNSVIVSLLLSLALTLTVELSLSLLLKVRGKDLLIISLANLLTNPVVNYCSYWAFYLFGFRSVHTLAIIILLEVGAVFIEYFIYKHLISFDRFGKLKLSLILNGGSFIAGIAVSILIQTI